MAYIAPSVNPTVQNPYFKPLATMAGSACPKIRNGIIVLAHYKENKQ